MKGHQFLCSWILCLSSDSGEKMGDALTLLLETFHKIEKAGGEATISVVHCCTPSLCYLGGETSQQSKYQYRDHLVGHLTTLSAKTAGGKTKVNLEIRHLPTKNPARPLHLLPFPCLRLFDAEIWTVQISTGNFRFVQAFCG